MRTLGGVSLFDFDGFDPVSYSDKYRGSNWRNFVPNRDGWASTVWIEVRRDSIARNFIGGDELLSLWHKNNAHGHKVMPIIECAHIGSIPTSAFIQMLLYDSKTEEFNKLGNKGAYT